MKSPTLSPNATMRALLLKDDATAGPIRFCDGADASLFQRYVNNLVSMETTLVQKRILFTTGLGLKSPDIPLRLPAVLVPVLRVMERMKELGMDVPQYFVYQAVDFIAETNSVQLAVARKISDSMMKYLREYIEAVHPAIADNIRLESHVPMDREYIADLMRTIRESVSQLLEDGNAVNRLAEYASRNSKGSADSCYQYSAANVLCNGAIPEQYPFPEILQSVDLLLPIGGRREAPFFALTRAMAARHAKNHSVIPLLVRSGELPTYYQYAGGDITDPDQCHRDAIEGMHGSIRYDFSVLEEDAGSLGELQDIYRRSQ